MAGLGRIFLEHAISVSIMGARAKKIGGKAGMLEERRKRT